MTSRFTSPRIFSLFCLYTWQAAGSRRSQRCTVPAQGTLMSNDAHSMQDVNSASGAGSNGNVKLGEMAKSAAVFSAEKLEALKEMP